MRIVLISILAAAGIISIGRAVADEVQKKYEPTEVQSLRLQLRQKDLIIAKQNFNLASQALNEEATRVVIENKWPNDLEFSQETLTFSAAKKPPVPMLSPGRVE